MITQEEMQEKNAAKYNIPMLEKSFRRGMEIAGNDPVAFFGRPITLCIMLIFVAMFVWGFIQGAKKKKKAQ